MFVVEVVVPLLRRFPAGVSGRVFRLDHDHLETLDERVGTSQVAVFQRTP